MRLPSQSLGANALSVGQSEYLTGSLQDPQLLLDRSAGRHSSRQDQQLIVRSRSKTSRTVSAGMLKWSLARSIKLGIFGRKVFQREMMKAQTRKSTIDSKQRLLIVADSVEARQMALTESKRSRSTADLHVSSSDSDEGEPAAQVSLNM